MIIGYKDICKITYGAERVTEENGYFGFERFTDAQVEAYKQFRSESMLDKTYSTSGVRLSFYTDSGSFSFDYIMEVSTSRLFGYFDIYEDGAMIHHHGDEVHNDVTGYVEVKLSEGRKHIEVYFPWSVNTKLANIVLDDGAEITPVKRKRSMVCFGDSITHGYDAMYPSLSYANSIARFLDADCINKAIGGEIFFPELLDATEDTKPDYVTVAYGTNDWSCCTIDDFKSNCREFLKRLNEIYSSAEIFIIAPIWRADGNREVAMGIKNKEVCGLIKDICVDYPNLHIIDGQNLVPHQAEFFSDERLHPNDLGFGIYANNLCIEINKILGND